MNARDREHVEASRKKQRTWLFAWDSEAPVIEGRWARVAGHFCPLRAICPHADLFALIWESLHRLITYRQFLVDMHKPTSEMLGLATRLCVLDCCITTKRELAQQVCRLVGWWFPDRLVLDMVPSCEPSGFFEKPYEAVWTLFISWL